MQLKYLLFSFSFFFFTSAWAQQNELKGYLGVEHGESFTYKLSFTDSSGYIKGFSYTWLEENKDVKAAITGYIDKKNKTLSFQETGIVYNHGFESNTTICLITALLKYKEENGNRIFSGPISSSDASNVYCGQGTISIMDNKVLQNLLAETKISEPSPNEISLKSQTKKPVKIVYDTVAKPLINNRINETSTIEKITEGKEKIYDWSSDSVIIEIWDGGHIDGDIVNVLFNDSLVLSKVSLTKEKKKISIPVLKMGMNVLSIIALNEGNEPPNTANLLLTDGDKQYSIIAYNSIGKKAIIKIKK